MGALPKKCFVVGSWDGFRSRREMDFTASRGYTLEVTLGKEAEEAFQVLVDGCFSAILHPNTHDAKNDAWLCGPDAWAPFCWKIGKDPKDEGTSGKSYVIRLTMSKTGRPIKIDWEAA